MLTRRGRRAKAWSWPRSEQPAIVLLDLLMPGVDGFAVVERLRADPATAGIPIVVLTSKTMTAADKQRLNGRISYLARQGGVRPGRAGRRWSARLSRRRAR